MIATSRGVDLRWVNLGKLIEVCVEMYAVFPDQMEPLHRVTFAYLSASSAQTGLGLADDRRYPTIE